MARFRFSRRSWLLLELSPLSSVEKVALLAALAGVVFFVVYFELRIIRGKSKEIKRATQRKDEAYNAILTTRSVMNVMQRQGADVSKALRLVESAKAAMQNGEYDTCKEKCEKAKDELTNPSRQSAGWTEAEGPDGDGLERVAENILSAKELSPREAKAYKGSKLPVDQDGNYLSAKFEISTAKADIGRARSKGQDAGNAQDLLTEAESAFVSGGYTKALSLAVKARKAIGAADESIPLKKKSATEEEEPEAEPTPEEASAPFIEECPSCRVSLDANDAFCHKCGERVQRERVCNSCGTKARPNDGFCRKCGSKVA